MASPSTYHAWYHHYQLCGAGAMGAERSFYFGNAVVDQVRDTGWFVGQFVPPELGPRHQTEVELKWAIHPDGDRRQHGAEANRNATTISVLIQGTLRTTFEIAGTMHVVTLQKQGDYVIFGPEIVHSWEALGHTLVLSVRFPSLEVARGPEPGDGREGCRIS
jgi:hypothetical protein